MKLAARPDRADLTALVAAIAHSPIIATRSGSGPTNSPRQLPAGFDDMDAAILDWIAAEGRRVGRSYLRM